MSLAFGKHQLSIPGPTVMPDRVLRAMHRAAPNIYEGEIVEVTHSVLQDLKALARCKGDIALYIGNGHAAWEASLCNVFSRGDKALGLVSGLFGAGWVKMAQGLGIEVDTLDFGHRNGIDPDRLEQRLRADTGHTIKAVLTVQTDTATSARNDITQIREAMDAAGHPALLMVDSIASFACEPLDMDAQRVDVMVTACQKGLMTPPGVAFMFMSERFWAAHSVAGLKSPYWNSYPRAHPSVFHEHFCGTAPTHHLYGLREAIDMLHEEGIENTWMRHHVMAQAVWAAVERWSEGGHMEFNVPDEAVRSWAVTLLRTSEEMGQNIRRWCEAYTGMTLGMGLSSVPGETSSSSLFRIGHMGHLNPPMLLGTLTTIESALIALDIEHGTGALEAAAGVIANHVDTDQQLIVMPSKPGSTPAGKVRASSS